MKLKHKIFALMAVAGVVTSCTDGFETVNQDPNKIYEVDVQSILPGTVYRTMNVISETNYNRLWSYGRQVVVVAFQKEWGEKGDGIYRQYYVEILRDIKALEKATNDDPARPNTNAIAKTWKAFVYYQLLSLYGPVGLTKADFDDMSKREFYYDSEETAYYEILDDLDKAVELFDPDSEDRLARDPVYGDGGESDIERWRKLANTLRLEIAMNIQNINEEKAREYAAKSMAHEDWLFSSLEDAFAPKYGTVDGVDCSYYYTRMNKNEIITKNNYGNIPSMNEYFAVYMFSYNDPRMEVYFRPSNYFNDDEDAVPYQMEDVITRAHDCDVSECTADERAEHLQQMAEGHSLRDSLRVLYAIPYVPTADGPGSRRPFGWLVEKDPTDPNGTLDKKDPLTANDLQRCYINERFYQMDINLPLLRWCDACFLAAEASVKFGLGSKTAQQYYEDGIRASFEEWGISGSVDAYMNQPGIQWGTSRLDAFDDTRRLMNGNIDGANGDEGKLEQIYKQRWFADFLDGYSAWRMERRTRALNLPPFFHNGSEAFEEGGNVYYAYPERLYFPDAERTTNVNAYYDAIDILQSNSPEPNDARWGDNVYTVLQFAKPVPNKAETIARYESMSYVEFNMDMQAHKYGDTYEDLVRAAREKTGITDNDEEALTEAFWFEIRQEIGTYVVE